MEPIFKCLHICFMKSKLSNSDSVSSIDAGSTDRSFVSHIKSIYAYYIHGIYAIHSLKLSCMHIRGCQILVGVNSTILLPSLFQSGLCLFYFEVPMQKNLQIVIPQPVQCTTNRGHVLTWVSKICGRIRPPASNIPWIRLT